MTGLAERRAVDAAIAELATITEPAQVAERAEAIAQHGNVALAAFIAALDTDDAQLRGGLGQVALRLPRAQVLAALRAAARSRERSIQARLTALTLLELFFNEPPDEALLDDLEGLEAMALRSLGELAKAMAQDPLAIPEYLAQLREQPPEVPYLLLQVVPDAPVTGALITLLRMLAQDGDVRLARTALEHLGRIRSAASARALAALAKTLPPSLMPLAERGARKLALSGVNMTDASDTTDRPWFVPGRRWRALVSPVDGNGAQSLWFIGRAAEEDRGLLLSVLIEENQGVTAASGALDVALTDLPPSRPTGTLHQVVFDQQSILMLLLEVPLAAGQKLLHEALGLNWASGTPTPEAYRLLNLPLWSAGSAEAEVPAETAEEGAASDGEPDPEATLRLLDHPAFWGWPVPIAQEAAAAALGGGDRSRATMQFLQRRFSPQRVAKYQARLRRMATWLSYARDPEAAALARLTADQMQDRPPETVPFLRRLVGIGFEVAELLRTQHNESLSPGG